LYDLDVLLNGANSYTIAYFYGTQDVSELRVTTCSSVSKPCTGLYAERATNHTHIPNHANNPKQRAITSSTVRSRIAHGI
jgi:hypothetical protein